MKKRSTTTIMAFIICAIFSTIWAQDENTSQAYWVHEDPVYPAKVADYEEYCSSLAKNCKKFNIQEANWFTISTDDLRYFHVSKIKNMADLDKSRFSVLQDKMGSDDFNSLFDDFDECYDNHIDYIIHLDKELSYMPGGVEVLQDGKSFRKLDFYYVTPQNFDKIIGIAKQFKALFVRKNSKEHFRVYRSGFGAPGQYLMIATSARNAEEFERVHSANIELLGAERENLMSDLRKIITKTETLNGYMRMDLSYIPE